MSAPDGLAAFALLAWLAFVVSRVLARRNIPELVGFLLVGALAGPSGAGLLTSADLQALQPVTEIALALLMFAIGRRVSVQALQTTRCVVPVAVTQYLAAAGLVYLTTRLLGVQQPTAVLLAAFAGAGAPMTVASVVASTRARGRYPDMLLGSHAAADALAVIGFAVVLPLVVLFTRESQSVAGAVLHFARLGIGGVALGAAVAFMIVKVAPRLDSGELLVLVGVNLFAGWAVAQALTLSLPLAALVAGAGCAGMADRAAAARMFESLRHVEQPLFLVFFALAGASIHLDALPALGVVGLGYIAARVVGKLAGGVLGGVVGGLSVRRAARLGVDSLPQAGVAVGLAVLAAEALPVSGGDASTVVLGAVVVFELLGPLAVARGLRRDAVSAGFPPGDAPETQLPTVPAAGEPDADPSDDEFTLSVERRPGVVGREAVQVLDRTETVSDELEGTGPVLGDLIEGEFEVVVPPQGDRR